VTDITIGQTWRRKKDGLIVRVTGYNDLHKDVGWKELNGPKRGAVYHYNFITRYELVPAEDELKRAREEFRAAVTAERVRATEKYGFTVFHDDEKGTAGLDHLIEWAIEYARLGEPVKAAGLMEAVRMHVRRNYTFVS
jgi:hypothetical protein